MNLLFHVISKINSRLNYFSKSFYVLIIILTFFLSNIEAAYIQVYSTTANGGISYTGNTLGLNKTNNQNNPGISGSIGAFITTNTSLQVNSYPAGTTLNWQLNSSTAVLDLPTGSTVLHAELIWAGSYGFNPAISGSVLDTPITFITPDFVSHTITPNPATAQSRIQSGSNGFYVRSADVTSLATSAGTYQVGGVPATVDPRENNLNCAGWTLAVVYSNPNMLTSSLTLFVACEASGAPAAVVDGIHAPDTGTISSRLFSSALEGDAQLTGDHYLVGETSSLSFPADAVSGTNNPASNFFASQINSLLPLTTDVTTGKLVATGSSTIDTRGSFGNFNSNAATGSGVSGARQGYDITSVDLGSRITNGQQQVYAQGTTNQDVYTVTSLGMQLQVSAPVINGQKDSDVMVVDLNDIVTFTMTFTNQGESDATSLIFTDPLATGLTYVPGSFTINGVPFSNPDLDAGVPLGDLPMGNTVTVVFQAEVTAINPPNSYSNAASVEYTFIPFVGEDPMTLTSQTNEITISGQNIAPPVANPDTGTTSANTAFTGTSVLSNDTGTGIFVSSYDVTTTQSGSVVMHPDGVYVYTPHTNFSGVDTFTYTITDSIGQTDTTTVTITVLPVAESDTGTVTANTPLNQTLSVLDNDIGTALTVTSYDPASTEGGTILMQPDGTYIYTPPTGFSGVDTFTYTATDSYGSTTSTIVTITVLPIAQNDFGVTNVNTPLNGSTVFTNDVGQGLTITAYDHTSIQGGSVVMNTTDGTYVYTPPNNYSGIDTFTYTVTDQQGISTVATVTITVFPLAVNDTGTTPVNVVLMPGMSVLANDLGTGLTVTSYNTVSLQGGTIVMATNGTYTYTSPFNFSGTDSFNYTATDSNGSETSAQVTITVTPQATNDTALTTANTTVVGSSVLANDTGSTLTVTDFQNVSTQGGMVSMNTNGTYTYMPPNNFSGIDTFSYTATDSEGQMTSATVTITVIPLAINNTATTPADTTLNQTQSVLVNDAGTGISVTSYDHTSTQGGTVVMQSDGTYVYSPPSGFSGTDTFTYTITDSSNNTATATVTITVTPIANPDSATTPADTPLDGESVLDNDIGTNLSILTYDHNSTEGGFIVMQTDGSYVYTPPDGFSGIDTFTYTLVDSSGNTSTATVTISVTPVAVNDSCGKTEENISFHGSSVLKNDIGSNLKIKSYKRHSAKGGTVRMQSNGKYVYTPKKGFTGTDTFKYKIVDSSGQTTTGKVCIRVRQVEPPRDCHGKINKHKFLNMTDHRFKAEWESSASREIIFYRVYHHGKVVDKIKHGRSLEYKKGLKTKHTAHGYTITAVNKGYAESKHVKIRVKYE